MPDRRPSSETLSWYDSYWLAEYFRCKAIIEAKRPAALCGFVDSLAVFRTRPDFHVKLLDAMVTDDVLAKIRRCIRAMHPSDLELHEAHTFGRFVVHNHVNFAELHHQLTPIVSLAAAEEVEPSYNVLCLYGSMGACPPHLDAPNAKWTLDLCIDQGAAWPIHISQVNSWPDSAAELVTGPDWEHELTHSPHLRFTSYTMKPGQALVFSGSSQWHYREPIPAEEPCQFCDLLFFHFIPKGTAELVQPENWTRLFGVPELLREVSAEDR